MFALVIVLLAALLLPTSVAVAEPTKLELDVIDYPSLVFDGDRVPITVRISNVGDYQAKGVVLESSSEEQRMVGDIPPEGQQEVTIHLKNYEMGVNEVDLVANYQEGKSATWGVRFEVRPPEQSITLRVVDAPEAIYEGMVYTAQLQIQNLRLDTVAGARIRSGDQILYQVGALEANQAQEIALRIDDYEIGTNHLELVADHELGTAPPLDINFQVIPADTAVRAYLGTVSSSTYLPETLELSIVIAAAEDAEIAEVELKALNDEVQPGGYYLGGQVAAEEEIEVFEVESLLTGSSSEEEEEEVDRAVRGRELKFEVRDPSLGTQSLDFRLTYRLGSKLIEQEFNVGTIVLEAPSVELILAERVEAVAGDDVVVTLHVANDLPVDVQAVRVIPLDDTEMAPSEFFIGTMSPDDFLPASFRLSTEDLQDGDQLSFKIVYRVGRETLETSPLAVTVHLEEPEESNLVVYIVPPLAVVLLLLLMWLLRRRRRWTQ
jgi:hypothetical protein